MAALKPRPAALLIGAVLMGAVNLFVIWTEEIFDGQIHVGVPFGFFPKGTLLFPLAVAPPLKFSVVGFVLDLVFWYAVAACLTGLYDRWKRRGQAAP